MNQEMLTALGVSGIIFVLIAFYLEHFKKYRKDHFWFNLLNLLGSVVLAVYAFLINSTIFAVLNAFWALAATWFLLIKK